MENQTIKKHSLFGNLRYLLVSAAWILLVAGGAGLICNGLKAIGLGINFIEEFLPRFGMAFIALWLFKRKYPNKIIGICKKGWKVGLILGWPIYVGSLINFYEAILEIDWSIAITPTVLEYIGYVLFVLSVGAFEEILLRGIMLNEMIERWGNTKKGIYSAIIASSAVFGLIHMVNLAGKPWFIVGTCTQVVYAFIIGFFFATVYVRTRNLWVVIVFHALYDLGGCLDDLFIRVVSESMMFDISIMDGVISLLPFMILFVIGLFYIRKEKLEVQDTTIDGACNQSIQYENA